MKRLFACFVVVSACLCAGIFGAVRPVHAAFPGEFWQQYTPATQASSNTDAPVDDPETGPLLVVTRVVPPFVIDAAHDPQGLCKDNPTFKGDHNRTFCGYSQELLQLLALKLERTVAPQAMDGTADNIVADLTGTHPKYNMAIGNMSVTSAREQVVDFSIPLPITNSGIQIMTRVSNTDKLYMVRNIGAALTSTTALQVYPIIGIILLLMLATAVIIYRIERNQKGSFLRKDSWIRGTAEAFWWILTAIFGQEEVHPKRLLSRTIAFMWIPFGVISVSLFTAAMTAALTARQIQSTINGVDDLRNKKVLTVNGSTSQHFLEDHDIKADAKKTIADAYPALENGSYDAIVYDAPVLQYYADHDGKGKVMTVGKLLKHESYAIAFPDGSPLREKINQALLQMQDDGTIDQLNYKWFEKQ